MDAKNQIALQHQTLTRVRKHNNDPLDFIIGKDEWEGEMEKSEVPRICEDHFTLDSFETTEDEEAHKVLMPDAIPTLKLKLDKPPTEENDSKPTEIDNGSENTKDGIFETNLIEKEKCCIPSCKSPGVVYHRFPQG
jgi:hypothetical protein